MKLSFSLPNKTAKPVGAAPPLKKSAAFASFGDDDHVDAAPTLFDNKTAAANKKLLAQNVESSKAARKRMEQEMKVDATVYQYDEVWDRMQDVKLKQKEAKEVDAKRRKPKYIEGLLTSAATRRLDHLRAEEKMMQREREAEGDEFADKEAFVTQAYKDQMAEVRRAEEEEKQRDEAEKKKRKGAPTGMAHFYRKLLEDSEQQHEEAVAATETKRVVGPQGPAPNLTITKPPELKPKSDLELAQFAREQGKDVELNDDNQIVDKRELLSAGLNLSAPNTRRLGLQIPKQTTGTSEVQAHQAVGTAASRREINERRAREIRQQLEEERERAAKQKEANEEEARQRTILKRNTQEDVQDIRARYLERKRRKLEEVPVASGGDDLVS
ncbi:coiled-coil domain-containing protein 55-domain containing protein [Suillus paluster]|uniref:coiled-coil domain-containing protein 55-domain containing protein n=1 Tax=Suillus paluster TaxID=48578 RepID=UPI001B86D2F1|nr:coiled-coil domain-containing protein 55-domain containing protein [Suillus paluster]KAG1756733.1 coiled-coil domain-containing protein 55-domain containing protein [Suillus paluster]